MSSALERLEPPRGPLPPAPGPGLDIPWDMLVALLLLSLLAWPLAHLLRALARRWRLRRGLAAVAAESEAAAAAQRLARLVRESGLQAPAAWWQAVDDIRFGRPAAEEHAAALPALCRAVSAFARRS